MKKMRSYINLTKVFLYPLNVKRIYYSSKILEFKKLAIEKKEVTEIKDIAEELNNFFTNVGPHLGKKFQILQPHSLVF